MNRLIILLAVFYSVSFFANAQKGEIVYTKPDIYQIEYPNQLINVYFNYLPDASFDGIVAGVEVSAERQYKIVTMLRNEIDKLPDDFIGKFLGIEIYAMHILSPQTAGYYSDNKIVLEIDESKLSQMNNGSIQGSFLHEVAHHIYKRMEYREQTVSMIKYLENKQRLTPSGYKSKPLYMESGYVSPYSSGAITGTYESDEEYAELFAHLVLEDSRNELFNYIEKHPDSRLADKTNKFMVYLEEIIPSLIKEYFHGNTYEVETYLSDSNEKKSMPDLLAAHEQKANESTNQKVFEEELPNEFGKKAEEIAKEFDTSIVHTVNQPEDVNTNFSNETSSAFSSNTMTYNNRNTKKQKSKKSKKSNNSDLAKMRARDWGLAALAIAMSAAAKFFL